MDVMTPLRQLIVMRHAKAGELPGGPDAERALRPRGCRNATAAGAWLAAEDLIPDLVLCSTARRAKQTWQYVSAELPAGIEVVSDPRLYEADAADLLDLFGQVRPDVARLMYVGHNPAAAEVTEILTGTAADFPTAATAVLGVPVAWADLPGGAGAGACELMTSWIPRADVG